MWLATLVACCVVYPALILGVGQLAVPDRANGSLVVVGDRVVGSELLAQSFSDPKYFWPRPSAVDYDASAAGGSNLSATNPKLRERAQGTLRRLGAVSTLPIPADLVSASGSGLDPDITLASALLQVPRIARTRGISPPTLAEFVRSHARYTAGVAIGNQLVRVLPLNVALDSAWSSPTLPTGD